MKSGWHDPLMTWKSAARNGSLWLRSVSGRVTARRRLAQMEAELAGARRQLRTTTAKLREAPASISEAHYALPDDVEQVIGSGPRRTAALLGRRSPPQPCDVRPGHRGRRRTRRHHRGRNRAGRVGDRHRCGEGSRPADEGVRRVRHDPRARRRDGADVHSGTDDRRRGRPGTRRATSTTATRRTCTAGRASFTRLGVPAEENDVELVKGLFEDTMHRRARRVRPPGR